CWLNRLNSGVTANNGPQLGRLMSVKDMVQGMINDLTETLGDAEKHDNGNSAAGTRVRKVMQAAKGVAQDVRVRVQGDKNSR
ncbi:MAG: hypothetical protein VX303_01185, partial [Candidatus Thermoplasmatota archaeon]|nr:hypothetical protein [Candidatus Thermoplasmatota archaeon]